jgi:fumarate hydratase subunit beta
VRLRTPLAEEDVRSLRVGDTVTITGTIYSGRDEMHLRALEHAREGRKMPFDLSGGVIFHTGPIMRKDAGKWKLIAAGPTTSSRMNSLEPEFIERFGVRAIIGKGGMSQPTVDAMAKFGCVYLAITGGAAVMAAEGITDVKGVEWLDLGMPEALWVLEAKGLGPLTVAIDTHGQSLYQRVSEEVQANLPQARRILGV